MRTKDDLLAEIRHLRGRLSAIRSMFRGYSDAGNRIEEIIRTDTLTAEIYRHRKLHHHGKPGCTNPQCRASKCRVEKYKYKKGTR